MGPSRTPANATRRLVIAAVVLAEFALPGCRGHRSDDGEPDVASGGVAGATGAAPNAGASAGAPLPNGGAAASAGDAPTPPGGSGASGGSSIGGASGSGLGGAPEPATGGTATGGHGDGEGGAASTTGGAGAAASGGIAGGNPVPPTGGDAGGALATAGGAGGAGSAGGAGGGGGACDPALGPCPCDPGLVRCDGVCIDPLTDPVHCGATTDCEQTEGSVGTDCRPLNSVCSGGVCEPCGGGTVACENRCLDPQLDPDYCGASPGCSPAEGTRGDRCFSPERCLAASCVECLTFSAKTSARLGAWPQQLAVADVTGDGNLDVVTPLESEGELVVFPGDGTGAFGEAQRQPLGTGPVGFALGRLDADALMDAVVGDYDAGLVRIATGASNGTFTEIQTVDVAGSPDRIVLADVNDDAALDAFVLGYDTEQVEVLLGNGDGTFALAAPIVLSAAVDALAAGDLDGDGRLDAVAAGNPDEMYVLLGDGTGSFRPTTHLVEGYTRDVALADLDGDQVLDAVTVHGAAYDANVSIGNGDGTFQTPIRLAVGAAGLNGWSVGVADFNADGHNDAVVGTDGGIYVIWGHPNWASYVQYETTVAAYSEARWLTIADLDVNGVPDIIVRGDDWTVRSYLGEVPAACL